MNRLTTILVLTGLIVSGARASQSITDLITSARQTSNIAVSAAQVVDNSPLQTLKIESDPLTSSLVLTLHEGGIPAGAPVHLAGHSTNISPAYDVDSLSMSTEDIWTWQTVKPVYGPRRGYWRTQYNLKHSSAISNPIVCVFNYKDSCLIPLYDNTGEKPSDINKTGSLS